MCDRCEELSEEVAYYRSELGLIADHDRSANVRQRFHLSPTEVRIMLRLYDAKGRFLSLHRLLDELEIASIMALKTHVCRIRKRMGEDAITTDYHFGYALSASGLSQILAALKPVEAA